MDLSNVSIGGDGRGSIWLSGMDECSQVGRVARKGLCERQRGLHSTAQESIWNECLHGKVNNLQGMTPQEMGQGEDKGRRRRKEESMRGKKVREAFKNI